MNTEVINILKSFNPLSIFLYGSQASQDTNSKSDTEIGVVFDDDKFISTKTIQDKVSKQKYKIFSFKLSEIENCTLDTPFQKKIYMLSLTIGNGKTIYGKKIIESLKIPNITEQDLKMDISFNLGYALVGFRLKNNGDNELANELFYKSMFYATRDLYYLEFGDILFGYSNIYEKSKNMDLPKEYRELLDIGFKTRKEEINNIETEYFLKNITYINKFVLSKFEK